MINKILRASSFIIVFSFVCLYSYILVFYLKFGSIITFDPKNLDVFIIYECIKILHIIALILAVVIPILIFILFIQKLLKNDIKRFKLPLLEIILCVIFLLITYFDIGNYIFWFFD